MSEVVGTLFSESELGAETGAPLAARTGILPFQAINTMLREKEISGMPDIDRDQVQPASLDLRLGSRAYRVRASFLPGPDLTVEARLKELNAYAIDLKEGAVLERGCVYLVRLMERLDLRGKVSGFANPKSSTGRLDILTRLIVDRGATFDTVPQGYSGPLYVEIAPRAFSVRVREGSRLNQIRFRRGAPVIAMSVLEDLHDRGELVHGTVSEGALWAAERKLGVTIDLRGEGNTMPVGFRAKKYSDWIDLDKIRHYDALDFWEPILYRHDKGSLILDPNDFYILATRESVKIPPDYAAEMIAYDTSVGEYRVHYAGFFDPGFGWGPGTQGAKAVLEVRSHEVPFMLEHGQTVGWLRYERMAARPDRLYGVNLGSNYQSQGLALAKQFKPVTA